MLLALHQKENTPLHTLSVRTSEEMFALQDRLHGKLALLLKHRDIVAGVLRAYIPAALVDHLGLPKILRTLSTPELRAYRDAILTEEAGGLGALPARGGVG